MTRSGLAVVALSAMLLPFNAAAQAVSSPEATKPAEAIDTATNAALVKLGGQLMLAGKAYEYDRVLADEIGPRLTGSPNYIKAADWAAGEFNRLGLSNVHKQDWEIAAAWEPEKFAEGQILAPHAQRLHLESDGWSPSTPAGGVRGNVYHLSALTTAAVNTNAEKIKGSIVLIDRDTFGSNGSTQFGDMLDAVALLAQKGALALLLGEGATNNVPSMFGLTCCKGDIVPLPVGNMGSEDSLLIRRMLDHGPVEVEFAFTNRIREHVKVPNVVAEIPGSDPGGEFVVIGGHLDSWQLGTGAEDNGTGAASVLAVAEAVKASGIRPRRTLRFVLFGGEEEGLIGSIQYVRQMESEMSKCAGVFVTDSGAEPPLGWYLSGRDDERAALAPIKPLLDSLGAGDTNDDGRFTFSTDHGPFLVHGVPTFMLWTAVEKYRQLHHKPSDTFDKVSQRDLNLGAAVVGVTALAIADAPNALKHFSTAEMEDQLKKIKSWDEYQDMQTHHMF